MWAFVHSGTVSGSGGEGGWEDLGGEEEGSLDLGGRRLLGS